MTMRRLILDRSGASAAEFAMVLPLLILLLFGLIDAGRFIWEYNRAEKATAAGARVAVVTNVLDSGIRDASYVGNTSGGAALTQGDRIPSAALGTLECTSAGCSCDDDPPCPTPGTFDTAAFNLIVQRMKFMKPDIVAANVQVDYSGSGLGYAGDPNGMEIAPLVTVRLIDLQFNPLILFGLVPFDMPDFRTTLTAEDSAGVQSN